jgi:hypothetical protein
MASLITTLCRSECRLYELNQAFFLVSYGTLNTFVDMINIRIAAYPDPRIKLLCNPEVVRWIYGDTSFLPLIETKNKTVDEKKYKVLEDDWGRSVMKARRPDLKLDAQWTNKFGEYLGQEMYLLLGKDGQKPQKKLNYEPDYEINDAIVEIKSGTYFTSGTAHEKILGCPFKYAELPRLYNKNVKILCIGGAEKLSTKYGNLGGRRLSPEKKCFLEFYKSMGIEYVSATSLLNQFVFNNL